MFVHDPYARGTVLLEVASDGIQHVRWDPKNFNQAVYAAAEGLVELWSPEDGAHAQRLLEGTGRPSPTVWHPAGGKLAVAIGTHGESPRLRVIDVQGAIQADVELPGAVVCDLAWSPDSTRLTVTRWVLGACVDVWDVRTPWAARTHRNSSRDAAWCVAWSHDGKYLVSTHNDGAVLFFDEARGAPETARPVARENPSGASAAWSAAFQPNSHRLVVSVGRKIACYDLAKGFEPIGPKLEDHAGACRRLAWSPNGKRLASGGDDGRVFLWDPFGGSLRIRLQGYRDAVEGLDWRADGRRLVSWAADATARVHLAHPEDVVQAAGTAGGSNELTPQEWERWLIGAGPCRPTWPFDASPHEEETQIVIPRATEGTGPCPPRG